MENDPEALKEAEAIDLITKKFAQWSPDIEKLVSLDSITEFIKLKTSAAPALIKKKSIANRGSSKSKKDVKTKVTEVFDVDKIEDMKFYFESDNVPDVAIKFTDKKVFLQVKKIVMKEISASSSSSSSIGKRKRNSDSKVSDDNEDEVPTEEEDDDELDNSEDGGEEITDE